jgi:hypothetical protein
MRYRVTIFYPDEKRVYVSYHPTHDNAYAWALAAAQGSQFVIDIIW